MQARDKPVESIVSIACFCEIDDSAKTIGGNFVNFTLKGAHLQSSSHLRMHKPLPCASLSTIGQPVSREIYRLGRMGQWGQVRV